MSVCACVCVFVPERNGGCHAEDVRSECSERDGGCTVAVRETHGCTLRVFVRVCVCVWQQVSLLMQHSACMLAVIALHTATSIGCSLIVCHCRSHTKRYSSSD